MLQQEVSGRQVADGDLVQQAAKLRLVRAARQLRQLFNRIWPEANQAIDTIRQGLPDSSEIPIDLVGWFGTINPAIEELEKLAKSLIDGSTTEEARQ